MGLWLLDAALGRRLSSDVAKDLCWCAGDDGGGLSSGRCETLLARDEIRVSPAELDVVVSTYDKAVVGTGCRSEILTLRWPDEMVRSKLGSICSGEGLPIGDGACELVPVSGLSEINVF